jgi:hypothetical protein
MVFNSVIDPGRVHAEDLRRQPDEAAELVQHRG